MLEFIGAFALTWWFIVGLAIFTTVLVHNEADFWSFAFVVTIGALSYFTFGLTAQTILYGALAYIPIGIVWSIWRWRRYCKEEVESYNSQERVGEEWGETTKGRLLRRLSPKGSIGRIVNWIFIWPFSLLDSIIGDLIDLVTDFVKKYLIRIYDNISGKYIDQIK